LVGENNMKIAVVTDSSSYLTQEEIAKYDLHENHWL